MSASNILWGQIFTIFLIVLLAIAISVEALKKFLRIDTTRSGWRAGPTRSPPCPPPRLPVNYGARRFGGTVKTWFSQEEETGMNHALIIDDNMIVSRAIQSRLEDLGFTSFDHAWTEEQAVAAARRCAPKLVVIGDEVESGSALGAARRISRELAVPVLMVTGDPVRAERRLAKVEAFKGPFLLNQIEEAVNVACTAPGAHLRGAVPRLAHPADPSRHRMLEHADSR